MEKLPWEMMLGVFNHLSSKTDISNLRLVQRDFAELGAGLLFNVVNITPTRAGLLPLIEISHRCNLACHVKKLVLQLENYRNFIWIPLKKRLRGAWGARAENARIFRETLEEIEGFQVSFDYIILLSDIFHRLPNLKDLQIQEMASLDSIDLTSGDEMVNYGLEDEWFRLCREERTFFVRLGIYRGFYALVTAAYFAGLKLVSFQSNARELFHGSPSEIIPVFRRCSEVFSDCRVLDLVLYQKSRRNPGTSIMEVEYIDPLLVAENLEKIRIRIINEDFGVRRNNSMLPDLLLAPRTWMSLKELELQNIVIPSADLLYRFLRRHRSPLRQISLQDCEISTGSWIDVIKGMRQMGLGLAKLELGLLLDHSLCENTADWHQSHVCLGRIYSEGELENMVKHVLEPLSESIYS